MTIRDTMPPEFEQTVIYLPQSVREGKRLRPRNLEALLQSFEYLGKLNFCNSLGDLKTAKLWLMPVFLGMSHRLASKPGDFAYYDALSQEEIAFLNANENGYAVLDMALESLSSNQQVFAKIHEGAAEAGIRPDKLVIPNCNARSRSEYRAYCHRKGITQRAHVIPYNYCLWMLVGHSRDPEAQHKRQQVQSLSVQVDRMRRKAFLSTNGRLRPHRVAAVLYMQKTGMLDKGLVSLIGYGGKTVDYASEFENLLATMPHFAWLREEIPALSTSMPMTLDTGQINLSTQKSIVHETLPWTPPDPTLFLDSYFSLVTETIVRDHATISITEKTIKPIMNMHPFLLVGGRYSLNELRRAGFKTFAPVIDESYDDVEDYQQRIEMVLAEAHRLAMLPQHELHGIYQKLLPRLQHNFDLFWNDLGPRFEAEIQNSISRVDNTFPE